MIPRLLLPALIAFAVGCGGGDGGAPVDEDTGADETGTDETGADAAPDTTTPDGTLPEVSPCNPDLLSTDPYNCGACGTACKYPSAEGLCVAGMCSMGKCQPGFVDRDRNPDNGCEYACWKSNGGLEICDGIDNDCNGEIDDTFDLASDPVHCGACDVSCMYAHAGPSCVGGKCTLGACADGFRDLDKNPANGCEYKCPVWPPTGEVCNGVDDDCNAAVDDAPSDVGGSCDSSCPALDPCVAAGTCKYTRSTCVGACCGICTAGTTVCASGSPLCVVGTAPKVEICNGADDNCDGQIDEGFDLLIDPNHCGSCAGKCDLPNAIAGCGAGKCTVVACKPGFANLDHIDDNGCEYGCPVMPLRTETCNGLDDDCNGIVDDPVAIAPQKPPASACRPTVGTPCAGADFSCHGASGWRCDYGPGVEVDASGKLLATETRCDGIDGNCNGQKDEAFADLGTACDNGLLGACRDLGRKICNPADSASTICDLSVLPDAVPGAPMAETCNGIDDDCNGVVDDGVVDDMVMVVSGSASFWIDRYEASHPDATATSSGVATTRACTVANRKPWTLVTQAQAAAACAANGRRLCTGAEIEAACASAAINPYPYGMTYTPDSCNGLDHDGDPSTPADDDVALATGAMSTCATPTGIYDLSGNVAEWTSTVTGNTGAPLSLPIYLVKGGSYATPAAGLTCQFTMSRYASNAILADVGFRCCK